MEPTAKKKVYPLLETLEAAANFNLKDLENEIAGILAGESGLPKRQESTKIDDDSSKQSDPNFSFVRHKQEAIPGLSISLDREERKGFGDGGRSNSRDRAAKGHDFRGRGGNFSGRVYEIRDDKSEEKPSTSSSETPRLKPEGDPFAEYRDRSIERSGSFDNRGRSGRGRGRDFGDGDRDHGRFHQRGGRGMADSNRGFVPRGGYNRGYDNRGRGGNAGDPRRFAPRGGGFDQQRSVRFDNRGRGFGGYSMGYDNRGNDRGGRGGRRGRRRGKMTPEEEAAALQRMIERDAENERKIRAMAAFEPPDG